MVYEVTRGGQRGDNGGGAQPHAGNHDLLGHRAAAVTEVTVTDTVARQAHGQAGADAKGTRNSPVHRRVNVPSEGLTSSAGGLLPLLSTFSPS